NGAMVEKDFWRRTAAALFAGRPQSNVDAFTVSGQSFFVRHRSHIRGNGLQRFRSKRNHAPSAQKIVGRQSGGPPSSPPRRKNVRRTSDIIPERHRGVVSQKRGPRIANLGQQYIGVVGGDVQVLR